MEVSDIISNAVGTGVLALATVVGSKVSRYLARREKRAKDLEAASEKIRVLNDRLGITPTKIETMDDVFDALRKIQTKIDNRDALPKWDCKND